MPFQLQFRHQCADTTFGTHVRAVGSCKALGCWNPEKSVILETNAESFPVWRSEVLEIGDDEAGNIEYKYIICTSDGKAERWEEGDNRVLLPSVFKPFSTVVVSEVFNEKEKGENERLSYRFSSVLSLPQVEARGSASPSGKKPASRSTIGEVVGKRTASLSAFEDIEIPTKADGSSGGYAAGADSPSAAGRANRRQTVPAPNEVAAMTEGSDPDLFSPTLRSGSRQTSGGSLSRLSREASRGRFGSRMTLEKGEPDDGGPLANPQELEPEVVDDEIDTSEGAMVREESASHLFLNERDCEAAEFESKYRLEGRVPLAEGSFGLVWVCSQRGVPTKVLRAVKIVHKSRLRPREFQLLLGEDGEIQTHLRLKHEHIVGLLEAFDDLRTVSLVMEYGRGGDLFDAITANRKNTGLGIPEIDAAVAQRHILLALEYLDSEHIVHRDIKCENVLLLHEKVPIHKNVLKLCDFGFATYDDGSGLTDRLGSPDTVAPEVIIGRPYGTKADVWSAGVMLFMMLSARSPFWAPTDAEVLSRVRDAEWSMTGDAWNLVSEPAKACVRAMMTADPSQRLSAKEILEQHKWLHSAAVPAA